jgi:hypothetical protein
VTRLREQYFHALGFEPCDKEKLKAALARAYELRSFEIEHHWKRATYFWGFQVAIFAAFGLLSKASGTLDWNAMTVALAGLGVLTAFAQSISTRASKFWQQNWERHIDMLEGSIVSVALRPLRIFVLSPESTARRVIFCKGAHNGRPFGRHKTTVVTAYRSVRRRRSKALAGRFEGTDCRGKPRAGGDCHRCRASPWVPAPAGARLAAPGAFGPVGTAGFGGHAVVRAGGIGIGATGGRRAHRVAGSSRCDG